MAVSASYADLTRVSGISEQVYAANLERIRAGDVPKRHLVPRGNEYTKLLKLYPKQQAFALLPQEAALAHGAGGTGKTTLALYLALQYADVPNYSALILRRTFAQLNLANSILDRFKSTMKGSGYHWNGKDHRAEFPNNVKITFGYLEHDADKYRYDSAEFQFIGIDEAVQFPQSSLEFLFARLRRTQDMRNIPLRYRLFTNPGGLSHLYLRNRFIENFDTDRAQMPFYIEDNPALDAESYIKTLKHLDPVLYRQRRFGDWYATRTDVVLPQQFLQIVDRIMTGSVTRVRFWDLAATAPKAGRDPDWTVGTLMARDAFGKFRVEHVERFRCGPGDVEERIFRVAKADGRNVYVRMEQEGGASGKSLVNHYVRLLAGWNVAGMRPGGPKLARWSPLAGQARGGNLSVVSGAWATDWLQECCSLTGTEGNAVHDDQMDSVAGALAFFTDEVPLGAVGGFKV